MPPESLTNAIGLNAVVFNMARSTGPALAGIIIATVGTGGSYSAQAIFFLLATVWTWQLSSAHRPAARAGRHAAGRESFGRSIPRMKSLAGDGAVRPGLLHRIFASRLSCRHDLRRCSRGDLSASARPGRAAPHREEASAGEAMMIASVGERLPRGILSAG